MALARWVARGEVSRQKAAQPSARVPCMSAQKCIRASQSRMSAYGFANQSARVEPKARGSRARMARRMSRKATRSSGVRRRSVSRGDAARGPRGRCRVS